MLTSRSSSGSNNGQSSPGRRMTGSEGTAGHGAAGVSPSLVSNREWKRDEHGHCGVCTGLAGLHAACCGTSDRA